MLDLKMIKTGTLPILSDKYKDKIGQNCFNNLTIKLKMNQISNNTLKWKGFSCKRHVQEEGTGWTIKLFCKSFKGQKQCIVVAVVWMDAIELETLFTSFQSQWHAWIPYYYPLPILTSNNLWRTQHSECPVQRAPLLTWGQMQSHSFKLSIWVNVQPTSGVLPVIFKLERLLKVHN